MITEKEISKEIGHPIKSPIRIGNLDDLGINYNTFISYFQPLFDFLKDDEYATKKRQIDFLKKVFPEDIDSIHQYFKPYFIGEADLNLFSKWIKALDETQLENFKAVSTITRQRNIASFKVEIWDNDYFVERITQKNFAQNVVDFRGWTREFEQASKNHVENDLFETLIIGIAKLVKEIHPEIKQLEFTSHFMRTLSDGNIKGENAPEGVHEDGAQYIMSALVIDRKNVTGGKTQIFEKLEDGTKNLIFEKALQPGEFVFQADTGEEDTFGNDLWHYVTPIQPTNETELGVRDIIGFDIDVLG